MIKILAVGLGGAIGSIARYAVASLAARFAPSDFPYGTFLANLLGCLFIGFLWAYFDRVHISNEYRLFLFTGFLGGFTTFSTFARETEQFFRMGETVSAFGYLLLSNLLGLCMVAFGFFLCHRYFR